MKVYKGGTILVNLKTKKIGLIYRKRLKDYTFPKGHLEKGESFAECAVRETAEETKRQCVIVDFAPIYVMDYIDGDGLDSRLYFYLAVDDGYIQNQSLDTHKLVWVPIKQVAHLLSYPNLRYMWQQIAGRVGQLLE